MKKIILILSAIGFIFFASCKIGEEKHDSSHLETTEVSSSADTIKQEVVPPVTLDRGQKWIANTETTRRIEIMKGLLAEFPSNPTENDYRVLHKKLILGFQSILQKCTMTGEARTQLQNYLMPLNKMIETLETGNLETCKETFSEMHVYLLRYSHYFF